VRVATVAAVLFALLLGLTALAPQIIRGPRLGRVIGWMLPPMRGSISVGGGRWSWGAVWSFWRGRPAALSLDDVLVLDAEGAEVLRAAQISASVELSRDHAHLVVRDLHLRGAAWRFAQMRGTRDVGFLAAFQPVRRAGARGRARGGGIASFQIVGADLDGLDAVFDFPAWGLALRDVHATGSLALAAARPEPSTPPTTRSAATNPIFTFVVSDADVRAGGSLRVLDAAARAVLPFSAGRIQRIATTAARPTALELTASVTTGRSRLTLDGSFLGIYGGDRPDDRPHDRMDDRMPDRMPDERPARARPLGAIDLRAHFSDAADAVGTVLARRFPGAGAGSPPPIAVAGSGATLDLTFTGPFEQLRVELAARGFDLGARGLTFEGVGGALSVRPSQARAQVTGLTFTSPAGGRLTLDATLDQMEVRGTLTLDHFATAPYLPTFLRPLAGGVLEGRVRANFDRVAHSAFLDEVQLTLARSAGAGGASGATRRLRLTSTWAGGVEARGAGSIPAAAQTLRVAGARFAHGTLALPEVSAALAGGRFTARAQVILTDAAGHLVPPIVDIDARARGLAVERLVGAGFARGALDLRARVRGALDDLSIALDVPTGQTLRVFGEAFRLPAATSFHFDGQDLVIHPLRLRGTTDDAQLDLAGRVGRGGDLALALEVRDFPLDRLPALAEADLPFSARLSGRLQATGAARAPRLAGQLTIERASFQGRPIGGGTLVITPGPGGAIHAAGQVIEGITLEGTLAPVAGGLRGAATLRLRAVRLDPFLALLPGGARAAGLVSGTLEAQIAPRAPPELEGRLSQLVLTVTGPALAVTSSRSGAPVAAPPPATLELHAVDEVRLSARAGGGPLRIESARFTGTPGSVELWAEAARGRARGALRGRLALGSIAPLALPWLGGLLSRLSGDLDFDVAAETARAGAAPMVTGMVRVATPVTFRIAGLPVDARVAAGQARLDADGIAHLDLPVTLGAGTLRLSGTVTSLAPADARAALDAAVDLAGDLDAHLLALAAPSVIAWAQGSARLDAHLEAHARPARGEGFRDVSVRARLRPAAQGLKLALRAAPAIPIEATEGEIDLDDQALTARGLRLRAAGKGEVTIGAAADGPAVVQLGSLLAPRPGRVNLPVRGRLTATTIAPLVIDDASFALRLDGDLARRARLTGEVTLVAAHVPASGLKSPSRAATATKTAPSSSTSASSISSTSSTWLRRPELARIDLDIRARSRGGAIIVQVPKLPDVQVDVDYQLRGTPLRPQVSGKLQGADFYSSFALLLRRIFQ
jgi:hypothetical protein